MHKHWTPTGRAAAIEELSRAIIKNKTFSVAIDHLNLQPSVGLGLGTPRLSDMISGLGLITSGEENSSLCRGNKTDCDLTAGFKACSIIFQDQG